MKNYESIITRIYSQVQMLKPSGQVANYIPEISHIDPSKFGVYLAGLDQQNFGIGDAEERFSIQSIAKVISLTMAFRKVGSKLWKRVGVEPSGTPFNSLVQLEYDRGIPRNPFINAGALVVCDILVTEFENPKAELLELIRLLSGKDDVDFNKSIAVSEKLVGYRNAALINLMKDFGNIKNGIDEVLDFYYCLCSIEMNCHELAHAFLFLANDGVDPGSGRQIVNMSKSKRINAIMQTCGFYDEAGEFSFKVGIPGKSGVGGGIVAVHPESFSIAVWSPALNAKGNSYKGFRFLERFTTETGISIF